MFTEIIFLTINFCALNLIEYFIHKLSHNYKYGGILYKIHHKHHTIDYPPNQLTVKKYDENSPDTRGPNIMFGIFYYFIIYHFLPLYYYILFVIQTTIFVYFMNMIHNYYHLEHSFLEKYNWFKEKKRLHHIHHINTYKNLGISFNYVDIFYETLCPKLL